MYDDERYPQDRGEDDPPASSAPRKNCLACYELIDERARLCRFCKQPQIPNLGLKILGVIGVVLALLISGGIAAHVFRHANRAGDVEVVESRIVEVKMEAGNRPAVVGLVRNRSPFTLERIELEIRYFDADDALVGIDLAGVHRTPPGAQVGFSATSYGLEGIEVARHEVRVINARAKLPWM